MPMNYWPSTPKKLPSKSVREFLGVNRLDPYSLNEGFSPDPSNLYSGKTPALTVRPGFTQLGGAIGTRVLGLASWKNSELHAIGNDGAWYRWNGTSWVSLRTGLNTSADWAFCNMKANLGAVNLLGSNGIDAVQRYNGTTVQALSGAPAGLKYIDQHDNRLYGSIGNMIYYSGLSMADSWTLVGTPDDSSPGNITRETNDGEDVIALRSGAGHVTVFFPNSSHELYGTSPSDFEFVRVAEDIGAINDQSIVNLGGVMYFLDETGIYQYGGGVRPRKEFSRRVQWFVDNMNTAGKTRACMGADGRYLYVAIPMSSTTAADTILVYDSIEDQWDVWRGINATHMIKMGDSLYMADAQGRVLRIGGTTDNGAAIPWRWVSKPLTGQSMSQKIRITRVRITLDKPVGSTVNVYITNEPEADSGWVLAGTVTGNGIQGKLITFTSTQVVWGNYLRIKVEGTGPCTIREINWDEIQNGVI